MGFLDAINKFQENVQLLTPAIRQPNPRTEDLVLWNLNSGLLDLARSTNNKLAELENKIARLEQKLR